MDGVPDNPVFIRERREKSSDAGLFPARLARFAAQIPFSARKARRREKNEWFYAVLAEKTAFFSAGYAKLREKQV